MDKQRLYEKIKQVAENDTVNRLNLSSEGITELPSIIGEIKHLKYLSLKNNSLVQLPVEIAELQNLTELNLQKNNLSKLPSELFQLNNLTKLDLKLNHLNSLPKEIIWLKKLKELNLSFNKLNALPKEIGELKNLIKLYLEDNVLIDLPAEIEQLINLKILILTKNRIKTLPLEIGQLKELTSLNISENELDKFPIEIGDLKNLKILNISRNKLCMLPKEIGKLERLEQLDLSENQFTKLPSEIGQLIRLEEFNLKQNKLNKLPEKIAGLKSLKYFYLGKNKFAQLPLEIGELKNLSKLDLTDNEFEILPLNILKLQLEITWKAPESLSDNQITIKGSLIRQPPGIEGKESLAAYFNDLRKSEKSVNEVKVLVLGSGGVGKTSLIRGFIDKTFKENESPTHGINIRTHKQKNKITLNFWDFGGQEIFHHTHQFFLSKDSIYILVLDARTEEEPYYWLDYIQRFSDNSPIIIVINKIDLNENYEYQYSSSPKIINTIKISCKEQTGMEKISQAIKEAISKVKITGMKWPQNWFAVKQHLAVKNESFINYDQYLDICKQYGVENEQAQHTLIEYLNRLGRIVHFKEFWLSHIYVLKPKWITEAIYRIMNHQLLIRNQGILDLDDLKEIFKSAKQDEYTYSAEEHLYIISLMKEFKLCYLLNKQQVLIPKLLPITKPKFNFDYYFNSPDTFKFIFKYSLLPDFIITSFIVFFYKEIKDELKWRHGVVIEHSEEETVAVVCLDKKEKLIEIFVHGQYKKLYFKTIYEKIQEIHKKFKLEKSKILQLVPLPKDDRLPDKHTVEFEELVGLQEMGESNLIIGKFQYKIALKSLLGNIDTESIDNNQTSIRETFFFIILDMSKKTTNYNTVNANGANINQLMANSDNSSMSNTSQNVSSPELEEFRNLVAELKDALNKALEQQEPSDENRKVFDAHVSTIYEAAEAPKSADKNTVQTAVDTLKMLISGLKLSAEVVKPLNALLSEIHNFMSQWPFS